MESPMRACVVHSQDVDSVDAVAELIAGAKVALGASLPRVAMLFAGIDHDFAIVLEQINAQWPGIALIGCTTDGEMSSHILFAEDSLALVLLSGDDFHAVSGVARSVSTDVAGSIRASVNDAVQRLAGRGGGDRRGNGERRASASHARRPDRERVRCPQCAAGGLGDAVPSSAAPPATSGDSRAPGSSTARKCSRIPCRSSSSGRVCLFLWCGYRMASHRARGAGH
jgi:Uncharacterized conserved protein